jgi:hypothetical protein
MELDIAEIVAALQAHLQTATVVNGWRYPVEQVICADGARFSVQASRYTYCQPRNDVGPWTHVEVMTITDGVTPSCWTHDAGDNLAGYVPIEAVAKEIWLRGKKLLTGTDIPAITCE